MKDGKVRLKWRAKTKRGQTLRYDDEGFKCPNCHRSLPSRDYLCRKLKGCPGKVRDRLLKGGKK